MIDSVAGAYQPPAQQQHPRREVSLPGQWHGGGQSAHDSHGDKPVVDEKAAMALEQLYSDKDVQAWTVTANNYVAGHA